MCMKIVFFTMSMNKGGAERVISILCNNGLGTDNEVHLITCLKGNAQYSLKDEVNCHEGFLSLEEYREMGKTKTLPVFGKQYRQVVEKINPDVIVTFLPEPCFIAELYKKKVGKVLIGSERSNPYFQYQTKMYKLLTSWLYPKSDGFVFQTEGARNFFGKKLRKKSVVIGNPVSIPESLKQLPEKREQEIVSVGRFTYEKNYPLLLKAFKKVVEKTNGYVLRIYGKVDKSLKLEELSKELGISDRVFFMGQVDDILEQIRNASVFVLSSMSEGMPNALMEAMAIGLPVVATDCPSGGPRQLIRDEENGLLVQNNDEDALAAAIIRIIENKQLSHKLSVNALKIADEYSEMKICQQWKEYIDKVVEENS